MREDLEPWKEIEWAEVRETPLSRLEDLLFFLEQEGGPALPLGGQERGRKRRYFDAEGRVLLELELPFRMDSFAEGEGVFAGRDAFFLFRAGSAALGLCRGSILEAHKCYQRYVVRGRGKAQPSHLKTKGKSRYGSRLRLQNFQRLTRESLARLQEWEEEETLRRIFFSCPDRLFSELLAGSPSFLDRDDPRLRKIPIHVHEPRLAELERVIAWANRARLRFSPAGLDAVDLWEPIQALLHGDVF
ncbi:MAG TPA: hypothetical protein ENK02_07600 [Planctomycetes bacterium]|nr:hypothetical protein [Planctomycetota bacterium]